MKRIMIVAGEDSGETHAARLVQEIRRINDGSQIEFFGLGGDNMLKQGVDLISHARDLAIIGTAEAIPKLWKYYRCFRQLVEAARLRNPDIILLVDFAEFNLFLAPRLKKLNFKIVYYISPQVWAWRKQRIEKIKRSVDKMLVILPFEKDFYRLHGLDVEYVGHPSADSINHAAKPDRQRFCAKFGLDPQKKIVSLLPGSRKKEVLYILPRMLRAAKLIDNEIGSNFLIAKARWVGKEIFEDIIEKTNIQNIKLTILEDCTKESLAVSDLAIVKSGTSTIDAILTETPFIIVYRLSWLTWIYGQLIVDTPHYGLANLIAGERIVPELFQADATPSKIAEQALALLKDSGKAEAMKKNLAGVKEKLIGENVSCRAAQIVSSMLSPERPTVRV